LIIHSFPTGFTAFASYAFCQLLANTDNSRYPRTFKDLNHLDSSIKQQQ
jgi:hypothetical protein